MEIITFVGQQIRRMRIKKDFTAGQLADLLGVTRQAVNRYELGKRSIKLETLYKLALIFNTDINYFFPSTSSENSTTTINAKLNQKNQERLLHFAESLLEKQKQ